MSAVFATSSSSAVGSRVAATRCSSYPGRLSVRATAVLGVSRHPRERLGGDADGGHAGEQPRRPPPGGRHARHQGAAGGGRDQHRPDHVRAAALVLLGHVDRVGVLLVAADRLVLGAVVAGHLRAADRHQAGTSDIPTATASAATTGSFERRATVLISADAASAAPIPGASNGSRASGSRRRSVGSR